MDTKNIVRTHLLKGRRLRNGENVVDPNTLHGVICIIQHEPKRSKVLALEFNVVQEN
jgi:hypothetical protein